MSDDKEYDSHLTRFFREEMPQQFTPPIWVTPANVVSPNPRSGTPGRVALALSLAALAGLGAVLTTKPITTTPQTTTDDGFFNKATADGSRLQPPKLKP